MAAIGEKDSIVVEKVTDSAEVEKDVSTVADKCPATKNGAVTDDVAETKENGNSDEKDAAEKPLPTDEAVEDKLDDAEETSGKKEVVEEANGGDANEHTPTEGVKRKVSTNEVGDAKCGDAASPEKKAKLDDTTKEEVQNGSEPTEAAA